MHEQIFITALVVHILVLALRPWRDLEYCEFQFPSCWTPPANALHRGLHPVVRKKGRSKYPAGFA